MYKKWVDIAKGWAIINVVIAHCYNLYVAPQDSLCILIASLHNPVFFMASGILLQKYDLANEKNENRIKIIKKRFLDLVIPFGFWSLIYVGINMTVWDRSLGGAISRAVNHLWFLPTLFLGICVLVFVEFLKVPGGGYVHRRIFGSHCSMYRYILYAD